jgi:hypothetical protein
MSGNRTFVIKQLRRPSSINRKKYVFATDRVAYRHGYVRMLRSGRICEFQVWFFLMHRRQAPHLFQRRIHDALLTRLSNNDHLERNLSTFASEMASSAMILGSQYYLCPCFSLTGLMLNTGNRTCVSKVSGFSRRVRPWHVTN